MVKVAGTSASLVLAASCFVHSLPIKTIRKKFSIEESKRIFPQFKEGAQMVAKCAIEAQEKRRNLRRKEILSQTPSTSDSTKHHLAFMPLDNSATFFNDIPLSQSKYILSILI